MDTDIIDAPVLPEAPAADAAPAIAPAESATKAPATEAVEKAEEHATVASVSAVVSDAERKYPSLYDNTGTTILAVILGIVIVGGIQVAVQRIYTKAKSEHEILTRFVVSIVALVVGAYITDLLIAGPDTSLLSDDEHTIILGFIKDICLMVFAFYFGTKAASSPPSSGASE